MGEVWRARDHRIGRDVAIKVLLSTFAQGDAHVCAGRSESARTKMPKTSRMRSGRGLTYKLVGNIVFLAPLSDDAHLLLESTLHSFARGRAMDTTR
jgi:hypothetical protein